VASYRSAFFAPLGLRAATARAGNVIGGGDWAAERLVSDLVTSIAKGQPLVLRNPLATRPWQHVLEPLSGYLRLAACLLAEDGEPFSRAWNFGPPASAGVVTVEALARKMVSAWGQGEVRIESAANPFHEAQSLALDSTRAQNGSVAPGVAHRAGRQRNPALVPHPLRRPGRGRPDVRANRRISGRRGAITGSAMTRETHCRSCLSPDLLPVISLGDTALANALRPAQALGQPIPRYPLALVRCAQCSLVQITETVPPEVLFSHYLYFSSFSDTMLAHCRELSARVVADQGLTERHLVMEIASNDGYLLQFYRDRGIPVLGIEPAANIAEVAQRERSIPTRCAFFGRELAQALVAEGIRRRHPCPQRVGPRGRSQGFVAGLAHVLAPDGVAVVEVPYVRNLIDGVELDTIYHEHLCYFSLSALDALFARHGLRLGHAEEIPLHGGSLLLFAHHAHRDEPQRSPQCAALLEAERQWGVAQPAVYARFVQRAQALRGQLVALLADLRRQGARIAAYGAAAKGSTLLDFCAIGRDTLAFVVDRSVYKQGLYMPGVDLEIRPPQALLTDQPDYTLLLTWNFAAEIMAQQQAYRERGGRFIIPVPTPRIL
jgi:hypothetical protein